MIAIRAEIDRVAAGEWPVDESPLRHAPHTADDVATDAWSHPYSRDDGGLPGRVVCGGRSTSRRSAASTPPTATAT